MTFSFSKYYIKKIKYFHTHVLERVKLLEELSGQSPIFPILHFEIEGDTIIQYSEPINRSSWPHGKIQLLKLWEEFKEHVAHFHTVGYIHGDILKKNILFDGTRFRLVDHEMALKVNNELRVTFPWVSVEDFKAREVTLKTDKICLKATELRLFHFENYKAFRKLQTQSILNLNTV